MPRWLSYLLICAPGALAGVILHWPGVLVFALSVIGLVPAAGLIGEATSDLAEHLGQRLGGLLNATFGNAAELIVSAFAVHAGLLELVKASITGSIIGNTLLVLGSSLLVGGLRYQRQTYNARETSQTAAMMILSIAGLYFPATLGYSAQKPAAVVLVSTPVAVILLGTYVAYLRFTVFGRRQHRSSEGIVTAEPVGAGVPASGMSVSRALLALAGGTAAAVVCSEGLVGSVETVTRQLGWSEFFVGVVIVAIVGNAAEHYSAAWMAWRDRLDTTFVITAGSGIQVALFVAPVIVLASPLLGHPMDLLFSPLELVTLGLAAAIFSFISLGGETSWLEGVQLLAVYLLAAVAFFFL